MFVEFMIDVEIENVIKPMKALSIVETKFDISEKFFKIR